MQVFWAFFYEHLLDRQETYLLAGDESVVTKAGKDTYGLDYFSSSMLQKAVRGLSFFTLALISIQHRRSYPVCVEPMIHTLEEKAATQAKRQAKKSRKGGPKRKPGRLKGSHNKNKAKMQLNPELLHIQKMLHSFLNTTRGMIKLAYLALDDHFGNYPALHIVRQCGLHLISKLRYDVALFYPYSGPSPKRGSRPKREWQVDVCKIPDKHLKETIAKDGFETRTYQLQLLHREFLEPLNVVIVLKINLKTKAWSTVVLFSSDLELPYDKMIDFYSLRFQIEFNFRDAKQF